MRKLRQRKGERRSANRNREVGLQSRITRTKKGRPSTAQAVSTDVRWVTPVPSARDLLISRVHRGELEPSEAEAIASEKMLGPLATRPPSDEFDPMSRQWWTLPMTIAWIVWRTPEKVRDHWDDYLRLCWDWMGTRWPDPDTGRHFVGHLLRRLDSASLNFLKFDAETSKNSVFATVKDAVAGLWSALGRGSLPATGTDFASRRRAVIPAHGWSTLEWREVKSQEPVSVFHAGSTSDGYTAIRLQKTHVVSLWPPAWPKLDRLPTVMGPDGAGHMTLYSAVQWIGTKGRRDLLEPTDEAVWQDAFAQLLARIVTKEVAVSGVRDGERREIDPKLFVGIKVEYPFAPPAAEPGRDELCLSSFPYVDDVHEGDTLRFGADVRWSKLMVEKPEVARFWSYGLGDPDHRPPGRPSTIDWVEAELRRRQEARVMKRGIGAECRALSSWFSVTYPNEKPNPAKTIENRLRKVYWELHALPQNK